LGVFSKAWTGILNCIGRPWPSSLPRFEPLEFWNPPPPQIRKKAKKRKILNAFKKEEKEEKDYHTQTMANFVIYVFKK